MATNDLTLEARLRALTVFLPLFERPDFEFGAWPDLEPMADGSVPLPEYRMSTPEDAFVQAAYDNGWVLRSFDWPSSKQAVHPGQSRGVGEC